MLILRDGSRWHTPETSERGAYVHPGRLADAETLMKRATELQRQFIANASHELRTPLTGLRAELQEALMYPEETDPHDVLQRALSNADRLQAIVSDLLLLARLESDGASRLEEVGLAELVRAEVDRRSDRVPVRCHLDFGITIRAVRIQVIRLLTNLLDNSQRHAGDLVQVDVRRRGDLAELVVADDGPGIAEADRERIFERFSRLDRARSRDRGGTGLGLAIVREIAAAHGGAIEVSTSEAGGARFSLLLRCSAQKRGHVSA
ncbi:sensor histidine kinase (plasmid) [Streptosporangium sp. CA-135522]|uniref:sensor histidine kinase n=1 Tax=Streptosporangium sp. CA-135522 TaxID=3240072 RepID=UPI003D8F9456